LSKQPQAKPVDKIALALQNKTSYDKIKAMAIAERKSKEEVTWVT